MMPVTVTVQTVAGGLMPTRAAGQIAVHSVYANVDRWVHAGKSSLIPLGFRMCLPAGHCALLMSHAGLAAKHSIVVLGSVIDSGYTGEVMVLVHNHGNASHVITRGATVALMLITAYPEVVLEASTWLDDMATGSQGLGLSPRSADRPLSL